MEAPEKIYVPTAGDELHYHMACPNNEFQESIEFIRKDAFIEKAANFLNYKLCGVVATRMSGTIRPHHVAKQEVIEDFVKTMRGE